MAGDSQLGTYHLGERYYRDLDHLGNWGEIHQDGWLKGDAIVPVELRVRNRGGNCVWSASEACAVAAGWESWRGMTRRALEHGWHGADIANVIAAARDAKCEIKVGKIPDICYEAVKEGSPWYFQIPGHALCGVGIDDKTVRIIDNNGPPVVQTWSRSKFDRMAEHQGLFFRRRVCPVGPVMPGPNPNHPPIDPEKPLPTVDPPKPLDPPKPVAPAVTAADLEKLKGDILAAVVIELKKLPAGAKGDTGADGKQGPIGPKGDKGEDGKNVDPSTVAAIQAELARLRAMMSAIQGQTFTAELIGPDGKVKTQEFGAGKPLRLQKIALQPK